MCSHDEALLAAAASKVDLWHLPPPMLITEFPQLNIAQHPQSWSLNFTLPQSLNLFRPPTQAVAWWNSLWSIQIPKTCGQVERYDKVWQQVLCQWKCVNFRSCRALVRFPDPPYNVTFKSVGEPDKCTAYAWAFFFVCYMVNLDSFHLSTIWFVWRQMPPTAPLKCKIWKYIPQTHVVES